jgi:hypothetical protein
MAFWFVLVVAAFLFIATIAGDPNVEIPNSMLGLMGISAVTGLAGKMLGDGKAATVAAAAGDAVTAAAAATVPADQIVLVTMSKVAAPQPTTLVGRLGKFATEMVSTGGGTTDLHRLQVVVWSLVLGLVFVRSVVNELSMPDFDTSLLGLMGISSGTYIGFKAKS